MASDRRFRTLRIATRDGSASVSALLAGTVRPQNWPADASVVNMAYDASDDMLVILLHSETFQEVPPGESIPWFDAKYETSPLADASRLERGLTRVFKRYGSHENLTTEDLARVLAEALR